MPTVLRGSRLQPSCRLPLPGVAPQAGTQPCQATCKITSRNGLYNAPCSLVLAQNGTGHRTDRAKRQGSNVVLIGNVFTKSYTEPHSPRLLTLRHHRIQDRASMPPSHGVWHRGTAAFASILVHFSSMNFLWTSLNSQRALFDP